MGQDSIAISIPIGSVSASWRKLILLEAHSAAAMRAAYVASETVPIVKLDTIAPEYLSEDNRWFLTIDTQGLEWQVLDGASETLVCAQGVLCELSLVPLYEGQRLWSDLIKRLENAGFAPWSIQKGFADPRDGRALQIDASFCRN